MKPAGNFLMNLPTPQELLTASNLLEMARVPTTFQLELQCNPWRAPQSLDDAAEGV
jgi:hypothetical protein